MSTDLEKIALLRTSIEELTTKVESNAFAADKGWIMTAGVLVFMMNVGFALLESGTVRFKNYQNILLKNVMHALVGGLIWWGWGYGFAYGVIKDDQGVQTNSLIGQKYFFGQGLGPDKKNQSQYADWWFQYAFAATAATIVSGSVAERLNVFCYITFAFFMIGFIYPIIVFWTWGGGWLAQMGFEDFAGSGIVHLTGGIAGLVGAIVCGPRIGRFTDIRTGLPLEDEEEPAKEFASATYEDVHKKYMNREMEIEHVHAFVRSYQLTLDERSFSASSPQSVTLGTLILWVGWMFFNGGSSLTITDGNWNKAGQAMVNTIIAPSAAGLFTFLTRKHITGQNKEHRLDFGALTNGLLAGCVSITASCADVEMWAAIIIGIVGSFVYSCACLATEKLKIDDPIEAFQVHGCCGMWGIIAFAFFKQEKGIFYGHTDSGKFLGVQLLGIVSIAAWSGLLSLVYFGIARAMGKIRLSEVDELLGGDIHYFGPLKMEGKISQYSKNIQVFTQMELQRRKSFSVQKLKSIQETELQALKK